MLIQLRDICSFKFRFPEQSELLVFAIVVCQPVKSVNAVFDKLCLLHCYR